MDYSEWLLPVLSIVIGIYDLFKIARVSQNPEALTDYIKNSPKASLWRKLFGVDKAVKLAKTIFLPVGIGLGVLLILLGIIPILLKLVL